MLTFKQMHFSKCRITRCSGDQGDIVKTNPKERAMQMGTVIIRGGFECLTPTDTMQPGQLALAEERTHFIEDNIPRDFTEGMTEEEKNDFSFEQHRLIAGSEWICVSNHPDTYSTAEVLFVDGDFTIEPDTAVFVADGEIIFDDKYAPIDSYFKPRDVPVAGLGTGRLILIK